VRPAVIHSGRKNARTRADTSLSQTQPAGSPLTRHRVYLLSNDSTDYIVVTGTLTHSSTLARSKPPLIFI
jgi:hypothetical protein